MDYTMPSMDDSQDVQLIFAQQDEDTGETAWGVVIPQNSCDEPYDYAIEDRQIFMIWAYGSDHGFGYHGDTRGQFTANLMAAPPEVINLDEYEYVDLAMPNVSGKLKTSYFFSNCRTDLKAVFVKISYEHTLTEIFFYTQLSCPR